MSFLTRATVLIGLGAISLACGSDDGPAQGSGGSGGSAAGAGGSDPGSGGASGAAMGGLPPIGIDGGGNGGVGAIPGNGDGGPYMLPPGFTKTNLGGYKLGDPFTGDAPPNTGSGGSATGCGTTILGVVRDFKGIDEPEGHPDFQAFDGKGPTLGMVSADLGADSKPAYTGICEATYDRALCKYQQQSTSAANFLQWYNYAENVNKPYIVYLSLEPNNGVYTFHSDFFFPLDNAGWGNFGKAQDKKEHNFNFTTEVHTEFKYNGGEKFTFIGDDDVWVFVNKKLAVDLGGLHPPETGAILLDERAAELGLVVGNTYALDLFHAERHTNASNFRVDSNLQFTNCGKVVPDTPR